MLSTTRQLPRLELGGTLACVVSFFRVGWPGLKRVAWLIAAVLFVGCGVLRANSESQGSGNIGAKSPEFGEGAAAPLGPLASAGPDLVVIRGTRVDLDGSHSRHPLDQAMTFRWTQLSGDAPVTLSNPTSATTSFVAPAAVTTIRFRLRAQTASSVFSDDEVVVHVREKDEVESAQFLSAPREVDVDANVGTTVYTTRFDASPGSSVSAVAARTVGGAALELNVQGNAVQFTAPSTTTALSFSTTRTLALSASPSLELDSGPVFTILRPRTTETVSDRSTVQAPAPVSGAGEGAVVATTIEPGTRITLERNKRGAWQQVQGIGVALTVESSTKTRFDAPRRIGPLSFIYTPEQDAAGALDIVRYQVSDPVLENSSVNVEQDVLSHPGNVVVLNGEGSTLNPGVNLHWSQTLGGNVALLDSQSLTPNFTAPATAGELCFTATLKTANADGARASVVVRVRPTTLNEAPIVSLDATDEGADIFTITATARDPERDPLGSGLWTSNTGGVQIASPSQASTSVDTAAAATRPVQLEYRICDSLDACTTTAIEIP